MMNQNYDHNRIVTLVKEQRILDVKKTQINMPNEFVEEPDDDDESGNTNSSGNDRIDKKMRDKNSKNKMYAYNGNVYMDDTNELDYEENIKVYSKDWMGTYTKWEINYLEKYLSDLRSDFKIINRNHLDYARKIAKASLAMDKAYDEMVNLDGDSNRYKTMKETFDSLCKSAQFSENQRGANDVGLGDFGSVFDQVEKNIFVYEHEPENKDIYDLLLEQFSNIKKSL
jgi:hypothetical protein